MGGKTAGGELAECRRLWGSVLFGRELYSNVAGLFGCGGLKGGGEYS